MPATEDKATIGGNRNLNFARPSVPACLPTISRALLTLAILALAASLAFADPPANHPVDKLPQIEAQSADVCEFVAALVTNELEGDPRVFPETEAVESTREMLEELVGVVAMESLGINPGIDLSYVDIDNDGIQDLHLSWGNFYCGNDWFFRGSRTGKHPLDYLGQLMDEDCGGNGSSIRFKGHVFAVESATGGKGESIRWLKDYSASHFQRVCTVVSEASTPSVSIDPSCTDSICGQVAQLAVDITNDTSKMHVGSRVHDEPGLIWDGNPIRADGGGDRGISLRP